MKTDQLDLVNRLAGSVWGHLIGDAVGVPYEFGQSMPAEDVVFGHTGTHRQPAGTWSDDGALMLALLDSLLSAGFDPEDQAERALSWRHEGAYAPGGTVFDIGNTTRDALAAVQARVPATDCGPADEHACGNGSLMRILPLALVGRDLGAAELIDRAHLASRVTHGHPRCQVACAVYCLAVVHLLGGTTPAAALKWAFKQAYAAYATRPDLAAHAAALKELRSHTASPGRAFVFDAFWSAWEAFAGAAGYADAIRRAVAFGHDTDTTAAIAGGLAGAYWGWDAIPAEWRRGMRGQEIATPLVDRLVAGVGAKTSTHSPLRYDVVDLSGIQTLEGATGRMGITFLPGKKRDGYTGLHWRDLDLDLAALRAHGVDALFLLVEDRELASSRVPELPAVMAAATKAGLEPELIRFPIHDPETPVDPLAYRAAVQDLVQRVRSGQSVVVACRGGIDRSGMTSACFLREVGLSYDEAIERTQAARRGTITRPSEQALVAAWPPTR